MILQLESNSLSINGLEDSLAVCFGNIVDNELNSYLMLECALDDDYICPNNDLYLELNDQSSSMRGGITNCQLYNNKLLFDLNPLISHELGLEEAPLTIEICFDFEDSDIEELNSALGEVFFKDANFYKYYA